MNNSCNRRKNMLSLIFLFIIILIFAFYYNTINVVSPEIAHLINYDCPMGKNSYHVFKFNESYTYKRRHDDNPMLSGFDQRHDLPLQKCKNPTFCDMPLTKFYYHTLDVKSEQEMVNKYFELHVVSPLHLNLDKCWAGLEYNTTKTCKTIVENDHNIYKFHICDTEPTERLQFNINFSSHSNSSSTNTDKEENNFQTVYMLMLDATSTFQFYHGFPETFKFLRENQFVKFEFLNTHGYNSIPNLNALMTGNVGHHNVFDLFKKHDWKTGLGNEYTYGDYGFPFSSAWFKRPDFLFAGNFFNTHFRGDLTDLYTWNDNDFGCFKGLPMSAHMLKFAEEMIQKVKKNKFIFNTVSICHSSNSARCGFLDKFLLKHLQKIISEEKNLTLILFADHGIHGSSASWPNTQYDGEQFRFGQREHLNPLLEIYTTNKKLRKMLTKNSHRLVSHLDLHKTIVHIVDKKHNEKVNKHAYDLFTEEVPLNRTCHSANIPSKWCNCWVPKIKI
jgi:hypothetical protein